jgi:hypothetical protein
MIEHGQNTDNLRMIPLSHSPKMLMNWWSRLESNPRPLECDHATPFQGFLFLEEISNVFDG